MDNKPVSGGSKKGVTMTPRGNEERTKSVPSSNTGPDFMNKGTTPKKGKGEF